MKLAILFMMILGTYTAQADNPCREDFNRICKKSMSGNNHSRADAYRCLKDHEAQLSPVCKSRLETHRAKAHALKEACGGDREKLCSSEKGFRYVRMCLQRNSKKLTSSCREKIRGIASQRK